jgi:hypothetical protein
MAATMAKRLQTKGARDGLLAPARSKARRKELSFAAQPAEALGDSRRMKNGQTKKVADTVGAAEKPPYEPTPIENQALAAYKAASETRGPRLKVAIEGDAAKINPDHPDAAIGTLALMQAIGTADLDFFDGLTWQLLNASRGQGSPEKTVNFMLAVIKGIEPRDQIEAMLGAQMAAAHMASMTFTRRLANVENIPQQDSAQTAFNKLARTFAAQVEALKRYRSGGEQKMTVQHVHVAEGGRAIVGNVSTPAPRGGGERKSEGRTPCSWICTGRRDAAPNRSGAGSRASHQRSGAIASAACMARRRCAKG